MVEIKSKDDAYKKACDACKTRIKDALLNPDLCSIEPDNRIIFADYSFINLQDKTFCAGVGLHPVNSEIERMANRLIRRKRNQLLRVKNAFLYGICITACCAALWLIVNNNKPKTVKESKAKVTDVDSIMRQQQRNNYSDWPGLRQYGN